MTSPRASLVLASVVAVLSGPTLAAQTAPRDSSAYLRLGGDVSVPAGTREGAVLVVHGNAIIAGEVRGVVVLEGEARITGGRVQELTVVRGRAILSDSARVEGDVHLVDAEIAMDSGSVVVGEIERGLGRRAASHLFGAMALIGLGIFLAFVLAGVFAAALLPDPLQATGRLIASETGAVALAAALLWLAGPLVAVLLIPTLIGLPIGVGYLVFVMPMLGAVGLIVAGAWVGARTLALMGATAGVTRPTVATAVGVTLLLLVGRIPVLGLVAGILMLLGAGAAALRTVRALRPGAPS